MNSTNNNKIVLVGDNPFQGVSHLSQERARQRNLEMDDPAYCANLVRLSLENGANGFMFSVSEKTLMILKLLKNRKMTSQLYAIAPAASDYVRLASSMGMPGLALHLIKQIAMSGNYGATVSGFRGVTTRNPASLLKAYIFYELYRIKSVSLKLPDCFLLHEIVTEMGLALNVKWLFKEYLDILLKLNIKAGFETRNLPLLINRLKDWGIDMKQIAVVAPFNATGFQMCPSRKECEMCLETTPDIEVIAMSVLASGYIKVTEAIDYLKTVPQLKGAVVGVSKDQQTRDFQIFRKAWT